MTKAVAYLRRSGALESDSFPRQRETIQHYADANDIEILEWFEDGHVRGVTEFKDRQGLASCMARCETNGVRLVLVEISDRLARDTVVFELIIREFQRLKVQVISASGGLDLTAGTDQNPTAKLVRQILACVAEFDRSVIVLKLRAARERQRANGQRCEGRKPYGIKVGEAEILTTILNMKAGGYSAEEIARGLNCNEIKTRYGKPWSAGTISKILSRQEAEEKLTT
jgi:DNA invertase Pin-like site-specific DNA recombinase